MKTTQSARGNDASHAALELLAREAPLSQLDDLVDQAKQAGAPPETLDRLTTAHVLAQRVQGLVGRRREHELGLARLVGIARELTMHDDPHTLLTVVPRQARMLFGTDTAYISYHYPVSMGGSMHSAEGLEVPLAGAPVTPHHQGPMWTSDYLTRDDLQLPPELANVLVTDRVHALATVPLRSGDRRCGALYVADRRIRYFNPNEVSLLTSLGALVEVALERAVRTERRAAEVARLRERLTAASGALGAMDLVQQAQCALTDLVLRRADLATVVSAAAETMGGVLVVLDAREQVIAATGPAGNLDGPDLRAALVDAHTDGEVRRVDARTWIAPIRCGDGELLLLYRDKPLDDAGTWLLRGAAQTIAITRLLERGMAAAESHIHDELLDDLLIPAQRSPRRLAERARRLAVDLSSPHVVVVARPEGGSSGRAMVWASSYASRTGGLTKSNEGCVVLLLPGTDPSVAGAAVSAELSSLLGHSVSVGAAGPTGDMSDIPRVHREAVRCLDVLSLLDVPGGVASPRELGFLGVLLSDDHDIDGFIDATLGAVINYDREHYTELTQTLEAYFDSGGSPTYAAEALYVHPNTVSRRLGRITALLGTEWQTPAQSMEIQLALRLRRTRRSLITDD